ncbi:MAG: hypothetical protein IJ814_02465 [Paludibacteraceae bacterium]|nr:hypothetical protein [Paludibacteraceae bacterium]
MKQVLDIVARALSVALYPLFVPTYGMALFCYAYSADHRIPAVWVIVALCGTLLLTCILPATAIWSLIRKGKVSSMQIFNARERTYPYLYTALGFGFWTYLLAYVLHAPAYISLVAVGATIAIGLVAVINHWWKISAHLTGLGGLLGGILSFCLGSGIMPSWGMLAGWLAVTLVLMWARLYLNAHTSAQVAAGWLLGLSCTFFPYAIACYVS